MPSKLISLREFIFDFFKSNSKGDVFDWNDLKPILYEPFDVMKRGKIADSGYRGVMHVHSAYSYDAKLDLSQLKSVFKSQGLSFACLTEHVEHFPQGKVQEFVRDCREMSDSSFVLIPGFEVSCNGQHVMLVGVNDLDLNLPPLEMIETAKKDGAIVVLAHPHRGRFTTGQFQSLLDGVEIWNSQYDGKYAPRTKAIQLLNSMQKNKPELKAFAGLDMHRIEHLGGPQIKIQVDNLNQGIVLRALRQGSFVLGNNRFNMNSIAQASKSNALVNSLVSPVSILIVHSFKKLSRLLRKMNIKAPIKIKAWLRKWI